MSTGRNPGPLGVGNSGGRVVQSSGSLGGGTTGSQVLQPVAVLGAATASGQAQSSASPAAGQQAAAGRTLDDFRQKVLEAAIESRVRQGRKHFPPIPDDELVKVEGNKRLRTAVGADFKQMMAAAREALAIQQMGPPVDEAQRIRMELAASVTAIGLGSAYREYAEELRIWNDLFPQYYKATEDARAAVEGGSHGDAAVNVLVSYYSPRKAPPGFSNHSDGTAVDLTTTQAGVKYTALEVQRAGWRTTWLHQWLVANAQRFNFHPLASEEWHWDHRR